MFVEKPMWLGVAVVLDKMWLAALNFDPPSNGIDLFRGFGSVVLELC